MKCGSGRSENGGSHDRISAKSVPVSRFPLCPMAVQHQLRVIPCPQIVAERLNHFMVHTALAMEGTCTGEHGVGTGKNEVSGKRTWNGGFIDYQEDQSCFGSQQYDESRQTHSSPCLFVIIVYFSAIPFC